MKLRAIFLGSVGLFSGAVSAQSAHQHGVAELFFAANGSELQIELHSPADNLLGFEHAPVNQQQRQTLQAAQQTVQQIEQLFVFNQAECELSNLSQDWGELADGDHHHDAEHDLDAGHEQDAEHDHDAGHEHDAEHDHDAGHEHNGEHDHDEGHEHAAHQDINLNYLFSCQDAEQLTSIELLWFKAFPNLHKIRVQGVSERGQVAVDLGPNNNQVKL